MENETRDIDLNKTLIQGLLQKTASARAASLKYNVQALIVIYSLLVIVVLLGLIGANILVVASIAILGFAIFWLFTRWQGKKLEKQLYQEEMQYYKELILSRPQNDAAGTEIVAPVEIPLSQRELEILTLIARGNMNKEIARILGLSTHTVRNYTVRILRQLDVDDRTSAAVLAISRGWIKNDFPVQISSSSHQKKTSPL
jgi:DNA-binding CsgD family transcriptional regulator